MAARKRTVIVRRPWVLAIHKKNAPPGDDSDGLRNPYLAERFELVCGSEKEADDEAWRLRLTGRPVQVLSVRMAEAP